MSQQQQQDVAVFEPMPLERLGEVFTRSGLFSDIKEAAQAIVKILAGREIGFPPVASMNGVYIIEGKVAIAPALIAAKIKGSGKYDYRVREMSATCCSIEFFERGQSVGVSSFTIDDARQAGLLARRAWQQYPRNLLFARAMANGARWFCPDMYNGAVYTPEELGADVSESGEVITLPDTPPQQQQSPSLSVPSHSIAPHPQPLPGGEGVPPTTSSAPSPPTPAAVSDVERQLVRECNRAIFDKLRSMGRVKEWQDVRPYAATIRELAAIKLEAETLEDLVQRIGSVTPEEMAGWFDEVTAVSADAGE